MKKIFNALLIVIFIIALFFINTGLTSLDDTIYQQSFNNISSCINWVSEFYNVWSGRITLTILINIFCNLPSICFKIVNTIAFLTTMLASYKIITMLIHKWNKKMSSSLLIILFCSIFFVNIPVINSGGLWIAGAMNYLWPVSAMLVALIPFIAELKEIKIKKIYYVLAILANILAGFAEQTSAILLAFGIITVIWCKLEKRKINKILIIHLIIISIFTAINLLAPGNSLRAYSEELKWYPSYSMLSLSDKLVQGYIQMANHLINDTTLLFSIIAVISSYLIITNKKVKKINKYISVIPIIYVLLKVVGLNKLLPQMDIEAKISQLLFGFERFNINTIYSRKALLQLISSSFVIGIVAVQLIYSFKTKKEGIITSILYCASICSALIMSFTPTIYASGNRVYFATDFLMILISGMLWMQLFKKLRKKENAIWEVLLIVIVILAIILYINLYKTGTNVIIY